MSPCREVQLLFGDSVIQLSDYGLFTIPQTIFKMHLCTLFKIHFFDP